MKKLLSMLMALVLTLGVAVNTVVLADGDEETSQEQSAQETVDTSDIKTQLVVEFKDDEQVVVNQSLTGGKESIEYLQNLYASSGYDLTVEENDGVYVLSMPESELTVSDIRNSGIEVIEDKGLFATKKIYFYYVGDVTGYDEEAMEVGSVILKADGIVSYTNADKISGGVEMKLISGQNGSFVVVTNVVNWIGILLLVLILLAIAVVVVLIVIVKKNKKVAEVPETSDFSDGSDDILAQLVSESDSSEEAEAPEISEVANEAEACEDEAEVSEETENSGE